MFSKAICYPLLLVLLFFHSCGGSSCNVVPNVIVNSSFSKATHNDAFGVGGYAYVEGGVAGLIVYNMGTLNQPKFIAYDRCSTVNPEKRNKVVVKGALIVDEVSGAKWLLQDGSPADVAECPLKPYYVSGSGELRYYIQN